MTTQSTTRGASLDRAYHHWRERGALLGIAPSASAPPTMTIAISREAGAGGSKIAQAVADRINWPVYDRDLVQRIADDAGVHAKLVEQLDEKRPRWLTECLDSFADEKHLTGAGYAIRLRDILMALYCHGNCIIVGRGAAQVLPIKRCLRVRLIAPKLARVQQVTDRLGICEVADQEVAAIDRERTEFVKKYFHKDPTHIHGYDLTIDTSRFDTEDSCDLILAALQARIRRLQATK